MNILSNLSSLSSRKVLVTGASGFIGSHLAEKLVEMGALVKCFIHYNSQGSLGNLNDSPLRGQMDFFFGDVRDLDSLRPACRDAEVIFHLAALISVPYSFRSPTSFIKTNVMGTLNVLRMAQQLSNTLSRVVHVSSSEVYGTAKYLPMDEYHSQTARSPYAASKIAADKLVEAYYPGTPVVTVRPFNTFGPRQSMRAIIPTIITQCLYEQEVKLISLAPIRDFTYVQDTVDALILAAQVEGIVGEEIEGEEYNIGSGRPVSILGLVHKIFAAMGEEFPIITDSVPQPVPYENLVMHLECDSRKAREHLGWIPQYSLEAGLEETVAWFKEHKPSVEKIKERLSRREWV